jgi:4-carboxymuconolactone decarboxylase
VAQNLETIEQAGESMTNTVQPIPGSVGSDRFTRGASKLQEIDGHAGTRVVESLADIAPEFARYLIEFPFGDIYCRPGLDLKSREIATIAALTAMGNARPQLEVHVAAALNVGCSRQEIVEVLMQMAVYAGFPAALNGLFAAKDVFQRCDRATADRESLLRGA